MTLRRVQGRNSPVHLRNSSLWMVGVVVAVGVLALGVIVQRFEKAHSTDIRGVNWSLVTVRSGAKTYADPGGYSADLQFRSDGQVTGTDGLNGITGSYRIASNKLTINLTSIGAVGGTSQSAYSQAVSSVLYSNSLERSAVTTDFTVSRHTLIIQSIRWILLFKPEGSIH